MLRFSQMGEMIGGRYVLDIGCGKYTNLLKAACMMNHGPQFLHYIGIDYGPIIEWRKGNKLIDSVTTLIPYLDFTNPEYIGQLCNTVREKFDDKPYTITCFEVLEHMDFESQLVFMYHLSELMAKTNVEVCFFSTPNFNGSAAKNHISELSSILLDEIIQKVGIRIVDKLGLSAWKKFHKLEYVGEAADTPAVQTVLDYLDKVLPLPLRKMVWGALLDANMSNNILYTLETTGNGAIVCRSEELINKDKRQK